MCTALEVSDYILLGFFAETSGMPRRIFIHP